ncbi:MAG: hypothetical protein IH840_15690 [Candidatus Heimdallarchaeota archaeon]|nr:hypothetical protein [Candidatus Heimdallarchaeota archaeon]
MSNAEYNLPSFNSAIGEYEIGFSLYESSIKKFELTENDFLGIAYSTYCYELYTVGNYQKAKEIGLKADYNLSKVENWAWKSFNSIFLTHSRLLLNETIETASHLEALQLLDIDSIGEYAGKITMASIDIVQAVIWISAPRNYHHLMSKFVWVRATIYLGNQSKKY